jgi:hypothetical protein
MGRPMTGTVAQQPISTAVAARRPVTAVDFGETGTAAGKPSSTSVRSKVTIESFEETENWFADNNEASVCLVVGSDESEDEKDGVAGTKTSDETLRDMVKTANEYFARSAGDGGNWWE